MLSGFLTSLDIAFGQHGQYIGKQHATHISGHYKGRMGASGGWPSCTALVSVAGRFFFMRFLSIVLFCTWPGRNYICDWWVFQWNLISHAPFQKRPLTSQSQTFCTWGLIVWIAGLTCVFYWCSFTRFTTQVYYQMSNKNQKISHKWLVYPVKPKESAQKASSRELKFKKKVNV